MYIGLLVLLVLIHIVKTTEVVTPTVQTSPLTKIIIIIFITNNTTTQTTTTVIKMIRRK